MLKLPFSMIRKHRHREIEANARNAELIDVRKYYIEYNKWQTPMKHDFHDHRKGEDMFFQILSREWLVQSNFSTNIDPNHYQSNPMDYIRNAYPFPMHF